MATQSTYDKFCDAIFSGDFAYFRQLLQLYDVNTVYSSNDSTVLMAACRANSTIYASEVLHKNPNANIGAINNDGYTALMFACSNYTYDMTPIALQLIASGQAKPFHRNKYKRDAMLAAMERGRTKIIERLHQLKQSDKSEHDDSDHDERDNNDADNPNKIYEITI